MVSVLIVEDNAIEQLKLKNMLMALGYTDIHCVATVEEAYKSIETQAPTLLIADVFLKGETTLALVQASAIPTIFITISKDSAVYNTIPECYKYAYLVKPIEPITLSSTINLLLSKERDEDIIPSEARKNSAFLIRQGKRQDRVPFSDILWIEAEGNYTYLITESTRYVIKQSLRRTAEELPNTFVQTHKKYFVNVDYVMHLKENSTLVNNTEIPITRKFKKEFKDILLHSGNKLIKH